MGFSRPAEKVALIKDCFISDTDLLKACIGKTAVELRHVSVSSPLSIPIDLASLDSTLNSLTLVNDDFEDAELHPNYARFEHSDITDLVVGSHVVCDILDKTDVRRMKIFGNATVRYDSYISSLDVMPVGQVTILGCEIRFLDISGTVIVTHSHIGTLNLRPGGRLFYYGTKIDATAVCNRTVAAGKIKLEDPYVLNLLAMNEFDYMYG